MTNGSLMKARGAFCKPFDLHKVIIGLENQFSVFFRVGVLHKFYCILRSLWIYFPNFFEFLSFLIKILYYIQSNEIKENID